MTARSGDAHCSHEGKVWCGVCGWRGNASPLTDEEWLAWHGVDDQLNLILLRHGVRLRDVDMGAFRGSMDEYREAIRAALLAEVERLRAALREIDYGAPRSVARRALGELP